MTVPSDLVTDVLRNHCDEPRFEKKQTEVNNLAENSFEINVTVPLEVTTVLRNQCDGPVLKRSPNRSHQSIKE